MLKKKLNNSKVLLLGTSHFEPFIKEELQKIFKNFRPDIVLMELDADRYELLNDLIRSDGFDFNDIDFDYVHNFLNPTEYETYNPNPAVEGFLKQMRDIQWNLGKNIGNSPLGIDFISAIYLSKEHKLPIFLIDEPIENVVKKINRVDFREIQLYFSLDAVETGSDIEDDYDYLMENLDNENIIKEIQENVKKHCPNMYDILITQRNNFLTGSIRRIIQKYRDKRALILVGAGHFYGILDKIEEFGLFSS